jgi:hypothetical protein
MERRCKTIIIISLLLLLVGIPSLQAQWVEDGVAICTETENQNYPQITSDGERGAIITWHDSRSGNPDIYAQMVDADGYVQWTAGGVAICTETENQNYPQITSDGAGGAIITWHDYRSENYDIYAQRVDASGDVQWTADGVAVCTESGDQLSPKITSDGAGGAIITWRDYRSGDYDIYVQRVDASGDVQWTADGVAICTTPGVDQGTPKLTSDGAGGAIITWDDIRGGNLNIYIQMVDASGDVQLTTDGIAICTATKHQLDPQITSDGAGGTITTWADTRSGNSDIYAQRVDAGGDVQWAVDGVAICTKILDQRDTQIIPDGAGGAIITWRDGADVNDDVYAQRVDASGDVQWTANGVAICTAIYAQYGPQITSDGTGGAIIAWYDHRSGFGNPDIYTQRVDASGDVQWTADGVAVCTETAFQYFPQITSDDAGGAIITWQDGRSESNYDIYVSKVDVYGNVPPNATLLLNHSAFTDESIVTITWTLSETEEDMNFFILRSEVNNRPFEELFAPKISSEGLSFTFRDKGCEPGVTYRYRVDISDEVSRRILFETEPICTPLLPLTLHQNHPNPFNPVTTIKYYLPQQSRVILEINNVSGRRISCLVNEEQDKGHYTKDWNGLDGKGNYVASGVYFYRLIAGKETISRKMVLLR